MLEKTSEQAAYAVMSFGGFLGIGEKYHPLPWRTLTYDTAQGGYVMDIDRSRLEGAPSDATNDTAGKTRTMAAALPTITAKSHRTPAALWRREERP